MTSCRSADDEVFAALSAINITGPDENGMLWVSLKPDKDDPVVIGAPPPRHLSNRLTLAQRKATRRAAGVV